MSIKKFSMTFLIVASLALAAQPASAGGKACVDVGDYEICVTIEPNG